MSAQLSAQVIHTGTRGGACPMVQVSRRGTVFYSPARRHVMLGCDVARSRDGGVTFETLTTPRSPAHVADDYRAPPTAGMRPADFRKLAAELTDGVTLHPGLWRDPVTERLFVTSMVRGTFADGSGSVVAFSDDEGDTWHASPVGESSWDWGKLYFGPAATATSRDALARSGYPHVVYFSATGPTLIYGPNQLNYRSFDGGRSWERVADAFDAAACEARQTGFPQSGVVDSHGRIFRAWAGTPTDYAPDADRRNVFIRVLRSEDEGGSWQQLELLDAHTNPLGASLALDRDDRLHMSWADNRDGRIFLCSSADAGRSFSAPRALPIDGVAWASKPTLAAGPDGTLALAFWGSPQPAGNGADGWLLPDGRPYFGYLARLDHNGALVGVARIDDGGEPLLPDGESFQRSGEYLGAPCFATDGSLWAAFLSRSTRRGGLVVRVPA